MQKGDRVRVPHLECEAVIIGPTSTPGAWWILPDGARGTWPCHELGLELVDSPPARPQPNTTPRPVQTPLEAIQQRNAEHPPDLPPCFGELPMPTRRSPAPRRPYSIDGIGL